jgi:hypothetical protein
LWHYFQPWKVKLESIYCKAAKSAGSENLISLLWMQYSSCRSFETKNGLRTKFRLILWPYLRPPSCGTVPLKEIFGCPCARTKVNSFCCQVYTHPRSLYRCCANCRLCRFFCTNWDTGCEGFFCTRVLCDKFLCRIKTHLHTLLNIYRIILFLKGQCHEIFDPRFFSLIDYT